MVFTFDSWLNKIFSFFSEPKSVDNLVAQFVSTTQILLTWSHPDDKGIYTYEALLVHAQGQSKSTSDNSTTFENLEPGTDYTFSVTTKAYGETSEPSVASSFTSKNPFSCHTLLHLIFRFSTWLNTSVKLEL